MTPSSAGTQRARGQQVAAALTWIATSAVLASALAVKVGLVPAVILEAFALLLAASAWAFVAATQTRVRLFCTDQSFGLVDRWGRRRTRRRRDLANLCRAKVRSTRLGERNVLVLRTEDGRALLTLIEDAWDNKGLERFIECLAVSISSDRSGTLSMAVFARRFPGALPRWATHPNLAGAVLAVAIVAIASAIVLVVEHH